MEYSKEQLLTGLKRKDLKAYETLFHKYHGRLVLFAKKFTGDLELAKDIVQEAFLTLWEKSETLSIKDSPKSYLYQAVRNKSLNQLRHLQIKDSAKDEIISNIIESERLIYSDFNDPFYSLLEMEMEQKMEQAINNLPDKCREIFLLRSKENLKNKEVAEKMGISVKMVEKYISKSLRILRTELAEYISIVLITLLKLF